MEIILDNIGRRFNKEWIFKHLSYSFSGEDKYAILGPNGSGKSTLLQIIAGSLTPSEGTITYTAGQHAVEIDSVFQYTAMAAPYLELVEEFTLSELINFHFSFKRFRSDFDRSRVIDLLGFKNVKNKAVKYFSSGMKQRIRLALAFCSDTPLILLDEPASNLDAGGINWYHSLLQELSSGRIVVIGSNQEFEYQSCTRQLFITDYKNL